MEMSYEEAKKRTQELAEALRCMAANLDERAVNQEGLWDWLEDQQQYIGRLFNAALYDIFGPELYSLIWTR